MFANMKMRNEGLNFEVCVVTNRYCVTARIKLITHASPHLPIIMEWDNSLLQSIVTISIGFELLRLTGVFSLFESLHHQNVFIVPQDIVGNNRKPF